METPEHYAEMIIEKLRYRILSYDYSIEPEAAQEIAAIVKEIQTKAMMHQMHGMYPGTRVVLD